ncbi:hypothetical protein J2W55_004053 [Mucilaginibacter pocheonensis]|uniref:Uncharacterized protein n=1 Tax=Mucilaginibacter pocheonensis TaxID=398050 RepID=A0ABU1TFK8_9SPHI|nr:hypothetical protein [Mucilaginibacter pocheonensis]
MRNGNCLIIDLFNTSLAKAVINITACTNTYISLKLTINISSLYLVA